MKAIYKLDLQFFAEGAGGTAAGAGAPAAAAPGSSEAGQSQAGQPGTFDAKAELQKLREKKFGKDRAERMANRNKTGVTPPAAEVKAEPSQLDEPQAEPSNAADQLVQTPQVDAEARKAEFKKLVEGDYKDLATEWHNESFSKRYKQLNDAITAEKTRADSAMQKNAEVSEVVDFLMQRHNVNSPAELKAAIEADGSYWEEGAQKMGMTVDAYKNYVKTTSELRKVQEAEQIRKADDNQKALFNKWYQEGMQLKGNYPTFDLMTEINSNPQFHNLLKSGIPVELAYNVTHYSEITKAKEDAAAKAARDAYVEQLKSKNARPAEAALGGNVAKTSPAIDVTKLTAAQRAEIAQRAKKTGEPIRLR